MAARPSSLPPQSPDDTPALEQARLSNEESSPEQAAPAVPEREDAEALAEESDPSGSELPGEEPTAEQMELEDGEPGALPEQSMDDAAATEATEPAEQVFAPASAAEEHGLFIPRAIAPLPIPIVAMRVPRPVSPRPRVVIPAGGGGGLGTVLIVAGLLGAVGFAIYHFAGGGAKAGPAAPVAVETPAEPVAPVVAPSKPVVAEVSPVVKPAEVAAVPAPPVIPAENLSAPRPVAPKAAAPVKLAAAEWTAPLVLDPVAGRSPVAAERWERLLRAAGENRQWKEYTALLGASLSTELAKSPDAYAAQPAANPLFYRATLQHALGAKFTGTLQARIADSGLLLEHVSRLMASSDAMESLLRALTPKDDLAKVLETWGGLSADDPEALTTYRELAVACSLVLEKPRKFGWNGQDVTISAAERYQWYKQKNKANQLAINITKLSAWQLAWVVAVPVPKEEMEWALAELHRKLKQPDWGRAYFLVPYDMQKAVTGKMKTPYDYYTFAEILKKGGICEDRAYFCANTARCAGLPAVSISGDGARGPHAWIAWMDGEDHWDFSGRFEGYPAGRIRDPRNNEELSEQVFTRLSDRHAPSAATTLKATRFLWLEELQLALGQMLPAEKTLEAALLASPLDPEIWKRKITLWRTRQPSPSVADWKTFLDAMRRRFEGDTDLLKVVRAAEDEFMLSKMDAATAKIELRGDTRHLAKNKTGLTSLEEIRVAYKREADIYAQAKDYVSLRRHYREALNEYGSEAAKFKGIANDYWTYVKADPTARLEACRELEQAFDHHVETRGGDYFDVKSQNTAAEFVAACWREAGEVQKAERFEKEIAKRGAAATKAASKGMK